MGVNEEELKQKLTKEQYRVLREKGTETPFTGKYVHKGADGTYMCTACDNPLFASDAQFDSGTGWPSFDKAIEGSVEYKQAAPLGEPRPDGREADGRTEIICAQCKSHLGHVFDDLPAPRPNIYFVYAIRCDNDAIYIGQTQNLLDRWKEHCNGKGAEYTKKHQPKYILHYEEYTTREEAVRREKWLKTGFGRKWLQREIKAGRARQAGGPSSTGKRYCINSVCLDLKPKK